MKRMMRKKRMLLFSIRMKDMKPKIKKKSNTNINPTNQIMSCI